MHYNVFFTVAHRSSSFAGIRCFTGNTNMRRLDTIGLAQVRAVYSGGEGRLWELLMGEQIHIGGMEATLDLARRAGLTPTQRGVDLCCCTGAGMRCLVRFLDIAHMHGIDATDAMVELGRQRCREEGLAHRIDFTLAEVTATGLPDASADFVWGEDAWCYVEDKAALIAQAVRLVRLGGVIAFTDWCEGPAGLSNEQALRFMTFMKFPSFATLDDYADLLTTNGCAVADAADTGRFPAYIDLYLDMVGKQLTYDALKCIGFDQRVLEQLGGELQFVRQLARERRIVQARFIARKPQ
jgi:SAM-dependent methyltransferase